MSLQCSQNKRSNKITTLSYFIKRLKDCGYIVHAIFTKYGQHDNRKWTVLINPGSSSVYITCCINKDFKTVQFRIDDGGNNIPKSYYIITHSIEVIISNLVKFGVHPQSKGTHR